MQQFKFISIKLTFLLILGIVLGFYLEPNLLPILIGLVVLLLFLAIVFKKQTREGFPFFGLVASFTVLLLGVFVVCLSNPKNNSAHYTNHLTENEGTWLVKINEVLKPTKNTNRYIVSAKNLNQNKVTGKLLLGLARDSTNSVVQVDDELILVSKVKAIGEPLNPHQFNYQDYLKKQGVFHQLQSSKNQYIVKQNSARTAYGYAANFRSHLIEKLKKENFDEEELGVLQALLLGQRNAISEETYTAYKNAGAVHILAVSGLHIGILLLLLQFVLKPLEMLPKGKTIKLIVLVCLLWLFAFIAGLSASIVRAVTMFSFIAYAQYLNRPTNTFNTVALSMFFILLIKPLFLFQVGFQMSYIAVLAIVWIYPKLQQFWSPKNIFLRKGWQLLSVSLAAQLGVLPISLFYFHQFPALFFVSNLLIIPFLGIILGLGVLILFLTSIDALPQLLASFYNILIKSMNAVIEFIGRQEEFVFSSIPFDRLQLILGYLLVIGLVTSLSKPKFKTIAIFLVGLITFQGWVLFQEYKTSAKTTILLAHETANTVLLKQNGSSLKILGNQTSFTKQIIQDYKTAQHIDTINYSDIKNSYRITNSKVYLMDSLGIYPQQVIKYLILTQSPKINLERLLDSAHVESVIVDGSNYRSYVKRWKATCLKRKLPFHYTGEKGAYYFE